MQYIYKNKKLFLLLIAFAILMPLCLSMIRQDPPSPAIKVAETQQTSPTEMVTVPEDDPQKKLLEYVQNKKPLSPSDKQAKASIFRLLEGLPSGIIHQTPNITITYVQSADMFQVEITNARIDAAKAEALLWFRNEGMSKEGICNLPVSFYLNHEIASDLEDAKNSFNPLPPGC